MFYFFEKTKMEYILPNKSILPSTRCTTKEKSHKHMYKGKINRKPKQKTEKGNISQCLT